MTEHTRITQRILTTARERGAPETVINGTEAADALVHLVIAEHRSDRPVGQSLVPDMLRLIALSETLHLRVTMALLSALGQAELERIEAQVMYDALSDEDKAKMGNHAEAVANG